MDGVSKPLEQPIEPGPDDMPDWSPVFEADLAAQALSKPI